jgi:hypothetical protein
MTRPATVIDREMLRAAIRKLGHQHVFYLLDDAIDLVPPTKLHGLIRTYIDLRTPRPSGKSATRLSLLGAVKAFEKASLAREYLESFNVNSKNFREQSGGTTAWIADCNRLHDRCVAEAATTSPTKVRQAFDIIFSLLGRIDEGEGDVIFFADEAGSWQVGVDWPRVLPPWFKVLSATAEPEEYAARIVALVQHHCRHESVTLLPAARKVATPAQRQALSRAAMAATSARSRR